MLYAENFDNGESCFDPEVLAFATLSIENSELLMEVTDSRKLFWSTCEEVMLDNFTFEMDVNDDTSAEGFHFFGLRSATGPKWVNMVGLFGGLTGVVWLNLFLAFIRPFSTILIILNILTIFIWSIGLSFALARADANT